MGRRGGWFYAVKKVLSCGSEQDRAKRNRKSGGRKRSTEWDSSNGVAVSPAGSPVEETKLMEAENEQNRHAYSVALATAVAAEAAVAAAHAAAEVVRLTTASRCFPRTNEDAAAIKIQTAFRGYLARRALRALRGLGRLKSLVGGQSVKRQAATTLRYMQTLGRMQYAIHARRARTNEESSGFLRQIQQKREKELEKLRASIGENWDDSLHSKEQIEANLQNRKEAAIKRERALAYAYLHQQTWRGSSNSANQTFMDPNNPRWGWSWLEQWMAARPYENGNAIDKDRNADHVSVKQSRPASRQSPSTPKSRLATGKFRPPSPRGTNGTDDDSKSISAQSDRCRRHSVAGSSVRDDESLGSSSVTTHGYMASTESARARSRLASPVGGERVGTPEKGASGSAKKRLSFSGSPARPRRHSGPPKVEISPMKNITTGS